MDAYQDMIDKGLVELQSISDVGDNLQARVEIILATPYKDYHDNKRGYLHAGRILDSDLADWPRMTLKDCLMLSETMTELRN